MINLFVYGTLKRGFGMNRMFNNSKFVGKASTGKGYKMISLGGYPGVLFGGEGSVSGEVYEVSEDVLTQCDHYESNGFLYNRKRILISVDGEEIKKVCWVYFYARDYQNCKEVINGIWEG